MKLRIREMPNGKWILECKSWHDFKWSGLRIDKVNTKGASEAGIFDLPMLRIEPPASVHYPLTWHEQNRRLRCKKRSNVTSWN